MHSKRVEVILFNAFCRSEDLYFYFCTDISGPVVSSRFWSWYKTSKYSDLKFSPTGLADESFKEIGYSDLDLEDRKKMIRDLFSKVIKN